MGTESTEAEVRPVDNRSPWIAVGVILVGSYAAVLNNTVVGVALPAISDDLNRASSAVAVDWVVTVFLIGVVLALPVTGWLADRIGRRDVYIGSLLLFGLGALVCAAAPTMEVLVIGRFLQGLGGGALMPVGMAIVYDLFPPHRRGSAIGIWGVAIMAAPAAGPPLGGWVVDAASWRWIFGVFVVVTVIAVIVAVRWLPDTGHREVRRLDVVGWFLAAVGLVVVVVGFRQIGEWGPMSVATFVAATVAVLAFAALIVRSLRHPEPIIEFRMFAVPAFAAAMALSALLSVGHFAQLTFLPVELQIVRDLEPGHVGILLTPAALGTAAMMPIGGWLVDRIGARTPAILGLCLVAASTWSLAHLRPAGSERTLIGVLVLHGLGLGLVVIPTSVSAMNSLPGRFVSQATAMSSITRQLGGAMGVTVLSAVLVHDLGAVAPAAPVIEQAQSAYNRVFLVAFWSTVCAIAAALFVPGRAAVLRHHAERAAES
jgi:EmrB/QacA subfamily drug resistance transporter